MKRYIAWGLVLVLVFSVGLVLAAKPDVTPPQANPPEGRPSVVLPPQAKEVAPNVFYLGRAVDQGRLVYGYAIIDYKKGYGKAVCGNGICEPGENARKCPVDCGDDGGGEEEPDTSSCYTFFAKGAKWKTVEPWIVNPANSRGLKGTFVTPNLADNIGKWETAAGTNILGSGSITSETLVADTVETDGVNEVYFANIDEPGAIAITIVWGTFGAPPPFRELVEWDQVYNDVDFDWSASGEGGKMDFENIATHELGHSVGLGDLYTVGCSEQTMYGYAQYNETKKRTLADGDITGVQTLY